MQTPTNTISPLMLFWSMIYVLALLSIYTCIASFLARSRDVSKVPRKTNQKQPRVRNLMQIQAQPTN
jgi:hypothetical protein